MQTSVVNAAGNYTDLLSGILNVQVKNEDKIMKTRPSLLSESTGFTL